MKKVRSELGERTLLFFECLGCLGVLSVVKYEIY